MRRLTLRYTRTDTLFPDTTLFRSPRVVRKVGRRSVEMEFLEDDVAHRHGERGVGAGLRRQPEIAELGRLAVVGRDDDAAGALVADLGIEMGVGGARLGHVRSEEHTSELQSLMRISYAVFCLK